MTAIDLILKLHKSGELKMLYQFGLVSPRVENDRDIYMVYCKNLTKEINKTNAVKATAAYKNLSEKKIWKVIKIMEQKI